MSDTFQDVLYFAFLTPVVNFLLDLAPLFFAWAAFSIAYWLIPNTKVNFKFAAISGAFCSIAFYVIQWLFINGQIYVSKYNAIYGSFAFLPLFLIWLQLSWLIMLIGCVLTYSLQNVFTFNFLGNDQQLTVETRMRMAIIVMAVVAQRFLKRQEPLTQTQFAAEYNLPVHILSQTLQKLKDCGMIYAVLDKKGDTAIGPARDVSDLTVEQVLKDYCSTGVNEIAPEFDRIYAPLFNELKPPTQEAYALYGKYLLAELPIPQPDEIQEMMNQASAKD